MTRLLRRKTLWTAKQLVELGSAVPALDSVEKLRKVDFGPRLAHFPAPMRGAREFSIIPISESLPFVATTPGVFEKLQFLPSADPDVIENFMDTPRAKELFYGYKAANTSIGGITYFVGDVVMLRAPVPGLSGRLGRIVALEHVKGDPTRVRVLLRRCDIMTEFRKDERPPSPKRQKRGRGKPRQRQQRQQRQQIEALRSDTGEFDPRDLMDANRCWLVYQRVVPPCEPHEPHPRPDATVEGDELDFLVRSARVYGEWDPDVHGSEKIYSQERQRQENAVHHARQLSMENGGIPVLPIVIGKWADETTGNTSKRNNKFEVAQYHLGNVPASINYCPDLCVFIAAAKGVEPLHLAQKIIADFKDKVERGILAVDPQGKKVVLVGRCGYVLGDAPKLAMVASLASLTGAYRCRTCLVKADTSRKGKKHGKKGAASCAAASPPPPPPVHTIADPRDPRVTREAVASHNPSDGQPAPQEKPPHGISFITDQILPAANGFEPTIAVYRKVFIHVRNAALETIHVTDFNNHRLPEAFDHSLLWQAAAVRYVFNKSINNGKFDEVVKKGSVKSSTKFDDLEKIVKVMTGRGGVEHQKALIKFDKILVDIHKQLVAPGALSTSDFKAALKALDFRIGQTTADMIPSSEDVIAGIGDVAKVVSNHRDPHVDDEEVEQGRDDDEDDDEEQAQPPRKRRHTAAGARASEIAESDGDSEIAKSSSDSDSDSDESQVRGGGAGSSVTGGKHGRAGASATEYVGSTGRSTGGGKQGGGKSSGSKKSAAARRTVLAEEEDQEMEDAEPEQPAPPKQPLRRSKRTASGR
ncbi:hypothetical protein H9P43_007321 [Blastocladiella emersonii ATCC 22665]|nr:hypothetical protein H9P43_007321 [Blastocladiella emersonii ATCC 22665]